MLHSFFQLKTSYIFFIVFFISLLRGGNVAAQNTEADADTLLHDDLPNWIIRIVPTALFDLPTSMFMIGVEHRLRGRHSLEYQYGTALFPRTNLHNMNGTVAGYRARLGYRYYLHSDREMPQSFFIVGAQVQFCNVLTNRYEFVPRANNQYEQRFSFRQNANFISSEVLGIYMIRNDNLTFEFDLGIGLKIHTENTFSGLPIDATPSIKNVFWSDDLTRFGKRTHINFYFAFKIGYAF